jgi:oxygen-dependent protoporphyrinogen oxidase
MSESASGERIAVVGGGITGLSAAHRVLELPQERGRRVEVHLLEASDRLGGTIQTRSRDGFLLEEGPDAFITQKPAGMALCRRLGIDSELIGTNPACRRTLVVHRGRLYPVPEGFLMLAPTRMWPFATSRLFSWPGKLRMAMDLILPRRDHGDEGDESLASFVRRRLGREALERVAQPLVGGIYTADPETLSLRTTMPRFLDLETKHRSLILGMRKSLPPVAPGGGADSGARYSLFVSFKNGMSALIEKLEARLREDGAVHTGVSVKRIAREGTQWKLEFENAVPQIANAVILTCPANASAAMLRGVDATLSDELSAIEYASAGTMTMAFRREQVGSDLDGFGFVVPAAERRSLIAVTYSSVKFPGRAPDGWVSMRVFFGGATAPEVLAWDDATLTDRVLGDLRELIGLVGEPGFVHIRRWPRSMPQYPVGHLHRVHRIREQLADHPGLELAGNAFGGVGIPDCIQSGESAADRLLAAL